jgi:hypothetical protein
MDDCNCNSSTCDCCVNKPTTVETETTTLLTPAYFNDKSSSRLTNDELLATQSVVLDVAATLTLFNTNILNNAAFDKTEYTFVTDRLAEGAITQTEYREFLNEYNYTVDTATTTGTATETIRNNPKSHIQQFNDFLKETIAGVAVSSLCRFLSDPFNKITSAISIFSDFLGGFKSLKDLLASLENPLDALSGLAASLKAFANSLINSVKDIVNSIKEKVLNVASKINEKLSNIVGMQGPVLANLKKWFSKQFLAIQSALSDGNIANLIKNISTKIAEAVLGFAVLTLEAIQFLLFLFCKMATSVENNLISLLNPLNNAADSISPTITSLLFGSSQNTISAIIGGRPVPEPGILAANVQRYKDNVNSTGATSSGLSPRIDVTSNYSTHPPAGSWSNLEFSTKVTNNSFFSTERVMPDFHKTEHIVLGEINVTDEGIPVDYGYYAMQLPVLEKMNYVGKEMGLKLFINSACRHKLYNDYLKYGDRKRPLGPTDAGKSGVAKQSNHISGHALDVAAYGTNGLTSSRHLEFLELCWKVGFRGFGYYPSQSFLHCDVQSARDWNDGSRPSGWAPYPH